MLVGEASVGTQLAGARVMALLVVSRCLKTFRLHAKEVF